MKNGNQAALPEGYTEICAVLEKAITGSCVGIDTSFLLRHEMKPWRMCDTQEEIDAQYREAQAYQEAIFAAMAELCAVHGRQVWLSQTVVRELNRLQHDAGNPNRACMAARALQQLLAMHAKGLLKLIPAVCPGQIADFEILVQLEILRGTANMPLTLLSQDRTLAVDAIRKNETHSVEGAPVQVLFFDHDNVLRAFDPDMDDPSLWRAVPRNEWQPDPTVPAPVNTRITGGFGMGRSGQKPMMDASCDR